MEHLGKFYIRNGLESKLKQDDGSSQVRCMAYVVLLVSIGHDVSRSVFSIAQ